MARDYVEPKSYFTKEMLKAAKETREAKAKAQKKPAKKGK